MSSTTPEQGPRDGGEDVKGDVAPAQRNEPGAGASPAGREGSPGPGATGPDRAAMRTSLAERFASAKAAPTETAEGRTSSGPATTARMAAADDDPDAPRGPGRESSGGAAAAGAGAAAGAARTSGRPAPERPQPRPAARPAARPEAARPDAARPEAARQPLGGDRPEQSARPAGPRQVRLSLARVDPWSVMKLAFLLSIAVGVGIVVATAAMWYVLDTMHVFSDVQDLLDSLGSQSFLNLMEYAQFDRVISMAAVVAVVDILLLTALATLGAFLYNIVAALVGGLHLTLTDD